MFMTQKELYSIRVCIQHYVEYSIKATKSKCKFYHLHECKQHFNHDTMRKIIVSTLKHQELNI